MTIRHTSVSTGEALVAALAAGGKRDIFALYIFSRILRRVVYARKYNVSEKLKNYNIINRTNC